MERRRADRSRRRLTCELLIGDRRHPGTVFDLSRIGLFVQTSVSPPPGERVRVKLRLPDGAEVELEASVARRYAVPAWLGSAARGGIGLRVESADDAFLQLLDSIGPAEQESSPKVRNGDPLPPSSAGGAYRVRAKQASGSRSRVLWITAASEKDAKVAASADLDEGWVILAVDPLPA